VDKTLGSFIEELLVIGKPAPSCDKEQCVLEWVQSNTLLTQSIYDRASENLSEEDLAKVEELCKHTLEKIIGQGMASLGVLEV
jgi:arsenate reductase-like glutaredoxin family protein